MDPDKFGLDSASGEGGLKASSSSSFLTIGEVIGGVGVGDCGGGTK